jgi:hypothetical protein
MRHTHNLLASGLRTRRTITSRLAVKSLTLQAFGRSRLLLIVDKLRKLLPSPNS